MGAAIPFHRGSIGPSPTGKMLGTAQGSIGAMRSPTDPLFYAALTLQNIVVGSRYRVTRHDTGDQLATGVAAASSEIIASVPCFANPMQVNIMVRNASGGTRYKPFTTAAFLNASGASAYILQQLD
jgi:hypothetical protein